MASGKKFGWVEFITGFAAGSIATILFSRKDLKKDIALLQSKAESITNQLISKAKKISSDLNVRSLDFIESTKKFAEGKYSGTIESLEKEYYSLKYAINSAIDNYRRSSKIIAGQNNDHDDLYIDFEDEKLPKFVGMGRRKR